MSVWRTNQFHLNQRNNDTVLVLVLMQRQYIIEKVYCMLQTGKPLF
jgi:hypothetical protein